MWSERIMCDTVFSGVDVLDVFSNARSDGITCPIDPMSFSMTGSMSPKPGHACDSRRKAIDSLRFGSTAKVLAECKLERYRIS